MTIEDDDGERHGGGDLGLGGSGTTSPSSPLGAALIGKRAGETVEVAAPRGAWQARIVAVSAA